MPTLKTNLATAVSLICSATAFAGDLNAPSAPTDSGSAMYQLEDIYNRLDAGTPGSKRSGSFREPAAGPASTGHTLDEVMSKAPVADDANGVSPSGVLAGETYWSLRTGTGNWGVKSGVMPNNGGTGSQAQGQSHSLPRRTGTEPPLARGSHSGQTWQGT